MKKGGLKKYIFVFYMGVKLQKCTLGDWEVLDFEFRIADLKARSQESESSWHGA